MEIFKSNKGADKIAFRGYSYRKNTTNVKTQSWRCDVSACPGTASTCVDYHRKGIVPRQLRCHNHAPDPARIELMMAVSNMAESSVKSHELTTRSIVTDTYRNLTEEAQVLAPKLRSLAAKIQRKRRREEESETSLLTGARIPKRFKSIVRVCHDVSFLLHDDLESEAEVKPNERIVIFASDFMLAELQEASVWMMDAKFKTLPTLSYQLFTIYAVTASRVTPAIHALLPNASTANYVRVFQILKRARPNLNPRICVIDDEKALLNSLKQEFVSVSVLGCFHHFSQNVWRKVQSKCTAIASAESVEIQNVAKSLCSLAFLPLEQVVSSFDVLKDSLTISNQEISDVYTYFEDTYIGKTDLSGERAIPPFPPSVWNARQRMIDDLPITNHKPGNWHRVVQRLVDGTNPSIWKVIGALQKEGLQSSIFIPAAGDERNGKNHTEVFECIKDLVTRYDRTEICRETFLRLVSRNLTFNP